MDGNSHLQSNRRSPAILLTNVGSPEAPTARALRAYLAEFLADRRIVRMPAWLWLPILHAVILNLRPRRSAKLYANIWSEQGSPLIVTLRRQAELLAAELRRRADLDPRVAFGMRYGQPGIREALRRLRDEGHQRILVLPLFPQYSATTTASAMDVVFAELKTWPHLPELRSINDYHDHPGYLDCLAESLEQAWEQHGRPQRTLFSFHGIPLAYARAGDPYPHQCRRTANEVARRLGLPADGWAVAFQSRFGPVRWLQPYTDELLHKWGQAGIHHVHIVCPGFSADCLETLDEIDREGRSIFTQSGGKHFHYVPALNDRPGHIQALADLALANLGGWLAGQPAKAAARDRERPRLQRRTRRRGGAKSASSGEW